MGWRAPVKLPGFLAVVLAGEEVRREAAVWCWVPPLRVSGPQGSTCCTLPPAAEISIRIGGLSSPCANVCLHQLAQLVQGWPLLPLQLQPLKRWWKDPGLLLQFPCYLPLQLGLVLLCPDTDQLSLHCRLIFSSQKELVNVACKT